MTVAWQAAASPPDACPDPSGLDALDWISARVPGTAAAATGERERDYDAEDWWFRTGLEVEGEAPVLRMDGVATVSEVWLEGKLLLRSESMWARHAVPITRGGELAIRCRALAPLLAVPRKPRARWRTRLVRDGNLRWFRTCVFGRAPGFAPGPAPVGPWRPVRVQDGATVELRLRPRVEGDDGILTVRASIDGDLELSGPSGTHTLRLRGGAGELRVPRVARWWPHTHGEPALHDVVLRAGGEERARRRVGFRTLASPGEVEREGLDLHVNGVPIWARGAVWTPVDPIGLAPSREALRATLACVRDAGMNLLRIPGTGVYESPDFWDLCDELGLLVWHDFAFANLDYPVGDPAFRVLVEQEADDVLADVGGRPSLAVLCGNSEVEQQVAMLGLAPELGRGELFEELLPARAAAAGVDVPYVPSAPCGGAQPFRAAQGVANYFGVGAYRRPVTDARRARVRFASECLAFANVPDDVGGLVVHEAAWKRTVPRDAGAGWDFDDVRDFYLRETFAEDPLELRWTDHDRYLELSRAVTGEVMAAVFGEWRRTESPCRGGLVLWLRDLVAGAGWGLLDSGGRPKVALHHLRRALAPVAVWMTDEGLDGLRVHAANDRGEPVDGRLRVALYRGEEHRVDEALVELPLAAHGSAERDVEALLGRFVDVTWAYRFGPPAQDLVVASFERGPREAPELLSQAVFRPAGTRRPEPDAPLGLEATCLPAAAGAVLVAVRARRCADGVRITSAGFVPTDDAFPIEPGRSREILLRPSPGTTGWSGGTVTALNAREVVKITAGTS